MQFPDLPIKREPSPGISFFVEDVEFELPDQEDMADWLQSISASERKPLDELNVIFCSDAYLRQINVQYLQHDYFTDIITFQYTDGAVHGDLFISIDRVAENAQTQGVPFRQELCRVLAHGVLHLSGYKDKTAEDQQTMRAKEDFYLAQLPK